MRFFLVFIIINIYSIAFSQNEIIDNFFILPEIVKCNKNIKEISIESIQFLNDTTKSSVRVKYSKNKLKKIEFITSFSAGFVRKIEFDDLERLAAIYSVNNGVSKVFLKQFFNKNKKFPDSILIYRNNGAIEKYDNVFKNDLVVRQEHFINNVFQDHKEYRYDDLDRLIEKKNIFPENPEGKALISDETSGNTSLTFYPLDAIQYEHSKVLDTVITVVYKKRLETKEIIKEVSNDSLSLKTTLIYKNDDLISLSTNYKIKDSVSNIRLHFKEGKIYRYYNTYINKDGLITKWTFHDKDKESVSEYKYKNVYDKHKNWIRREIFISDKLTETIIRKIKY